MRFFGLICILLMFISRLNAQDEVIVSDRPDQSDGAYIIPKKAFQVENGVLFANETIINNFMCRLGVTNSTEVRLLVNYGKEYTQKGLLPLGLSFKQRLFKGKNMRPAISLVGYIAHEKAASKDFRTNAVPYYLVLAFQSDLNDKITFEYNLGTTTLAKDMNVTLLCSYAISDNLTGFVEYFAHFQNSTKTHNTDAGLMYLLSNNLQFDFACGTSIFTTARAQFFTLGASYKF